MRKAAVALLSASESSIPGASSSASCAPSLPTIYLPPKRHHAGQGRQVPAARAFALHPP